MFTTAGFTVATSAAKPICFPLKGTVRGGGAASVARAAAKPATPPPAISAVPSNPARAILRLFFFAELSLVFMALTFTAPPAPDVQETWCSAHRSAIDAAIKNYCKTIR